MFLLCLFFFLHQESLNSSKHVRSIYRISYSITFDSKGCRLALAYSAVAILILISVLPFSGCVIRLRMGSTLILNSINHQMWLYLAPFSLAELGKKNQTFFSHSNGFDNSLWLHCRCRIPFAKIECYQRRWPSTMSSAPLSMRRPKLAPQTLVWPCARRWVERLWVRKVPHLITLFQPP